MSKELKFEKPVYDVQKYETYRQCQEKRKTCSEECCGCIYQHHIDGHGDGWEAAEKEFEYYYGWHRFEYRRPPKDMRLSMYSEIEKEYYWSVQYDQDKRRWRASGLHNISINKMSHWKVNPGVDE